jgi:phenylalanyl-tRNA synthetase beta chain
MYDIGQPLHAFDADKVKGNIIIRAAKEGEKIILLDGRELILTAADNVIADDEGALVVAGAKGGKRAEISETTKRIMIESANFDPVIVRRTSTKYDIRSDSSKRFENEITQELAIHGMNNICTLINEMIPGSKFGPIVDEYPTRAVQKIINFDPAYLEERLGIKIPYDEAKEILEKMGVEVSENHGSDPVGKFANSGSVWTLTIPFERLDLVIKEDVVEEVGRVYGYDKVKGILPPTKSTEHSILPLFNVVERIKNILVDLGFSEVSLYTLVEKGEIETAKPLARDKAFARADLTLGMMDCVHKNALNADLLGLTAIKIFEVGHVFSQESESVHLALGASQIKKVKNFKTENIISEAVKAIENGLSVTMNGKITNSKIGNFCVYEINLDQVVKKSKPVSESNTPYGDLNFESASTNRYQKFSLYPFIVRDIAVFVPESATSETVWESIEKGIAECGGDIDARKLLVRHALFDTFKKDGKVSYAFRMIFQSMEKTLTDEEVNGVMTNINAVMKDKGWEVR